MEEEINLNNPIFVIYINVDGLPRHRAEEEIRLLHESYIGRIKNITTWIVPNKERTKVECVWDPRSNNSCSDLLDELNSSIKNNKFENLTQNIRNWKLNKLTNEETN